MRRRVQPWSLGLVSPPAASPGRAVRGHQHKACSGARAESQDPTKQHRTLLKKTLLASFRCPCSWGGQDTDLRLPAQPEAPDPFPGLAPGLCLAPAAVGRGPAPPQPPARALPARLPRRLQPPPSRSPAAAPGTTPGPGHSGPRGIGICPAPPSTHRGSPRSSPGCGAGPGGSALGLERVRPPGAQGPTRPRRAARQPPLPPGGAGGRGGPCPERGRGATGSSRAGHAAP